MTKMSRDGTCGSCSVTSSGQEKINRIFESCCTGTTEDDLGGEGGGAVDHIGSQLYQLGLVHPA